MMTICLNMKNNKYYLNLCKDRFKKKKLKKNSSKPMPSIYLVTRSYTNNNFIKKYSLEHPNNTIFLPTFDICYTIVECIHFHDYFYPR